jgi:hypothetical protein
VVPRGVPVTCETCDGACTAAAAVDSIRLAEPPRSLCIRVIARLQGVALRAIAATAPSTQKATVAVQEGPRQATFRYNAFVFPAPLGQ